MAKEYKLVCRTCKVELWPGDEPIGVRQDVRITGTTASQQWSIDEFGDIELGDREWDTYDFCYLESEAFEGQGAKVFMCPYCDAEDQSIDMLFEVKEVEDEPDEYPEEREHVVAVPASKLAEVQRILYG